MAECPFFVEIGFIVQVELEVNLQVGCRGLLFFFFTLFFGSFEKGATKLYFGYSLFFDDLVQINNCSVYQLSY